MYEFLTSISCEHFLFPNFPPVMYASLNVGIGDTNFVFTILYSVSLKGPPCCINLSRALQIQPYGDIAAVQYRNGRFLNQGSSCRDEEEKDEKTGRRIVGSVVAREV